MAKKLPNDVQVDPLHDKLRSEVITKIVEAEVFDLSGSDADGAMSCIGCAGRFYIMPSVTPIEEEIEREIEEAFETEESNYSVRETQEKHLNQKQKQGERV